MKIPILFEDDDVLAINKPAGLSVHPDGRTKERTLAHWIIENYPNLAGVGETTAWNQESEIKNHDEEGGNSQSAQSAAFYPESRIQNLESIPILRPGIVHRLDKETSGVMLVAKNQESFEHLKKQFQKGIVKKRYHAFLFGELAKDDGVIQKSIGRSPSDFRKRSAARGARGILREARTAYRVIKRGGGLTFVEALPETGRTHQIRVHFRAIRHPVVCDKLYGASFGCTLGFNRLALHARSVTFRTKNGGERTIEASYPADFEAAVKAF